MRGEDTVLILEGMKRRESLHCKDHAKLFQETSRPQGSVGRTDFEDYLCAKIPSTEGGGWNPVTCIENSLIFPNRTAEGELS